MPTCWPFDNRSDPSTKESHSILMLDIDLLLGKKTLSDIKEIVEREEIYSIPGVTFQAQLSDKNGNVLLITPGKGFQYKEHLCFSVLTNFSPFKGNSQMHPWMGLERYAKAMEMLALAYDDFDVPDCFEILKKTAQTVCPTVVSMVFDVTENMVYWCENREWNQVNKRALFFEYERR